MWEQFGSPELLANHLRVFFLNLISQSGCLSLVHFETCQGNSFMGALSAFTWQGPGVSNHWVISPVQESKKVDFVLLAYFALWYLGNYYYNITNKLLGKTVGYWATEIPKSWVGVVATSLGVWKPHLRCAKGHIHGGFQGWLSQNILVKFFDWGEVTNHQCIFFLKFLVPYRNSSASKDRPSQKKYVHLPTIHFQVLLLLVSVKFVSGRLSKKCQHPAPFTEASLDGRWWSSGFSNDYCYLAGHEWTAPWN